MFLSCPSLKPVLHMLGITWTFLWIFKSSSPPSYVTKKHLPVIMSTVCSGLRNVLTHGFFNFVCVQLNTTAFSSETLGFPFISRQIFEFLSFIFQSDLLQSVPLLTFLCQHWLPQYPTAPAIDTSFSNTAFLAWTNVSISLLLGLSLSLPSVLISIDLRFVFNCFLKL